MRKRLATLLVFGNLLMSLPVFGALNGVYTINSSLPASATNYLNFGSAVTDMVNGTRVDGGPINGPTVSGAVTFNVSAGTYSEKLTIPAIVGASATNTITFNGVGPLVSAITFNSTTVSDYTIQLNGADFFRFTNLGIHNTGPTYGYGVQLINSADNNIIQGCNISTPAASTSYYHSGIIAGTYYSNLGVNAANLSVLNNTISGGRFSVVANGTSATPALGLNVSGNTSTNAYFVALYIQYCNNAQITANNITLRANYSGSYGTQIRSCNGMTFDRNKILNAGLYGAYFIGNNNSSALFSTISNNMIGGGFQTTATAYGLFVTNSDNTNIYHNSILVDNPGTGGRALHVASSTANVNILNNALSALPTNGTAGFAMYVTPLTGIIGCDNNNYQCNGAQLVYFGTNYASLAALQAGAPSFNVSSQTGNPNFLSSTDLHTFGVSLANWAAGTPVTTDFDLQTRPLSPDITPDVGADEFLLAPIDPDLVAITSPLVGTIGLNTVAVTVQNNGGTSLNGASLTMEFSPDGGTTWIGAQTFTPTTLATPGSQQTFTFSTLWNLSTPGSYNLCVRINPIMPGDPDPTNQICISLCTGLAGTYTINNTLPTSGTNYNSFNAAVAALSSCGVAGPTTFNVAPGNYTETISIGSVLGASASNPIIFDGGNANLVNLNFSSSTANNSIVKLDGADHITFRNITVEVLGLYGFCFHLTNQADDNTIENCRLLMDVNTTSVYQIGVLAAGATYSTNQNCANRAIVRNNYIRGGYYGLRFNGISTTSFTNRNEIKGNTIEDFYYYGVYLLYQNAPKIDDNTIRLRTVGTSITAFGYGIYITTADSSFSISGNKVPIVGAYGIYLTGGNRNNTGKGRIVNNMVGGGFQSTGAVYGMYLSISRDIDIYHNSFHIAGFAGNALYAVGTAPTMDSLRIKNNIFSSSTQFGGSGGLPLRIQSNTTVQQLDNNIYFTGGASVADYSGIQYATLANWQAAFPAYNVNSRVGFPGFISDTDLHIVCSNFDNTGTPVGIPIDLDTQGRSSKYARYWC
jgi:hypothetical protein